MNLTYELTENGYKIIKDGYVWLIQEKYFPHKGATIQESAEKHIAQIIKDNTPVEPNPSQEEEILALKERLALTEQALNDLIMGGLI